MDAILIERIKSANDIVDVIGERMTITRSGVNYIAVCPFHADNTPSLTISRTKQIYKCFACGAGGDVIKFVQEYENIGFYEALKYLAGRAHIEIPEKSDESPEDRENRLKREATFTAMRKAQDEYLMGCSCAEFYQYLAVRGITQETANKFGLGYSSSGFFTGRITYPFYDMSNNIIGFTGRAIEWNKQSEYPKYKNSAENIIFHKERVIFGIQQAKRSIAEKGFVYWVEGQNDVLSLHQHGVLNVVCGSGTAFTDSHAKIIARFTNTVTLLFDGDTAGKNAILKTIKILLRHNLNINVVLLPDGEDPDSFVQHADNDMLDVQFNQRLFRWNEHLLHCYPYVEHETDANRENIATLLEYVQEIKDEIRHNEFMQTICAEYRIGADVLRKQLKPIHKTDVWENGYYGLQESQEVVETYGGDYYLTFDEEKFIERVGDEPILLWKGEPLKHLIQSLRSSVNTLYVNHEELDAIAFKEPYTLQVLSELYKEHIIVYVETPEDKMLYSDYYVTEIGKIINDISASDKAIIINRALELIAYTDATMRTMMGGRWAKILQFKDAQYNKLLQPFLDKIKDNSAFEKQNVLFDDHTADFDPYELPEYVKNNPDMLKIYNVEGYFPLLRKDGEPCAYVFRNDKGDGHSILSDFYIKPLLHIYSKEKADNKRIFQLIKRNGGKSEYVEWQSSTVTTLNSIDDQLVNQGAYTLKCTPYQYKSIRTQLLNGCVSCSVFNTYGWQPAGFWAFPNAIYHPVKSEKGTSNRIDYTDRLGIVEHNGQVYYSPACSEIYIKRDNDERNSQYVTDRLCVYRELPESDRISFEEWAKLMNIVHRINDNGKWAILFDILMCFRDYIHSKTLFFTTLFFIGKTGSGKSQIAESVRSLFMPPNAPSYNLNNVSLPAMNLVLERYSNMPVILEEYNDSTINDAIFQSLKSAVYDGEGRSKLGGSNFRNLETSVINAIPILLGQEAPQKDDGSLANRSILCDVPGKVDGAYSREEIEVFNRLKKYERAGLSNVLLEVLDIREIVVSHFLSTFDIEKQLLTDYVASRIKSSDGLSRTIETISLFTTICRIVEKYTNLKLPFTYDEFFVLATAKIVKQVEAVSTTNKISTYFQTMQYLLTNGKLVRGKEFKIISPKSKQIKLKKVGAKDYDLYEVAPEQKLLFINFSLVYNAYKLVEGREALSKQSLLNYFESNAAYIGHVKNTKFKYSEEKVDFFIDEFGGKIPKHSIVEVTPVTSAYVFDYDMISQLMDIDLVQGTDLNDE